MWIWNSATTAIVVLGAATAVVSALGEFSGQKIITIILPAISSFLGTVLIQFRVRELWQVREVGRISSEELIARAYTIPISDRDSALAAATALRLDAHKIEREQAAQFFAQNTGKPIEAASEE